MIRLEMSALLIVPIIFIIIGLVQIIWPELTRDIEQGLFRLIKDRGEYVASKRLFGVLFLMLVLGMLVLLLTGHLQGR